MKKKGGIMALYMRLIISIFCLLTITFANPPYPQSPVIEDIVFDHSSHIRLAPGSDNWAITWADDGHQYAQWGDGGGFGGTNSNGRVSFGIARIEGPYDNYKGYNVHGGLNGEYPSSNPNSYTWGLLCLGGVLYCFAGRSRSELWYSNDHGAHWNSAGWSFGTHDGPFSIATLLNFGQNYAGARDNYVYVYTPTAYTGWPKSTDGIDLARVPKGQIKVRNSYEFFAGLDNTGNPAWVSDINKREPVFTWAGKVHWTVNAAFIPGVNRYLLSFNTAPGEKLNSNPGDLAIFDAPEPWGPWTTVKTFSNFGGYGYTYAYHFPSKWLRNSGKDFTMVFSGGNANDSWNTVNGRFEVRGVTSDDRTSFAVKGFEQIQIKAHPNPFYLNTNLQFTIPCMENVCLRIYNIQGSVISTLINQKLGKGNYNLNWKIKKLRSGIFIAKLTAGSNVSTNRLYFIK
jgi:hypothetical protein